MRSSYDFMASNVNFLLVNKKLILIMEKYDKKQFIRIGIRKQ
jgi:hypothetical protein